MPSDGLDDTPEQSGRRVTQFPDGSYSGDESGKIKLVSENRGLQARGIGKNFGNKRVVRNVSIGVRRGEAVGLLGPNGAGKTTTFYMLSGLMQADEGSIFLDGNDVTETP
ncbi:MAG: ATP-binding cassette domain-containing protein, partial [Alphaproteobacteria bacterium]|nr:ATP-binding cassette domain-containing protein [Alphaproteobacteria bacterium]